MDLWGKEESGLERIHPDTPRSSSIQSGAFEIRLSVARPVLEPAREDSASRNFGQVRLPNTSSIGNHVHTSLLSGKD